jgi:H(+)-transporting ATP synthase, vacuolar type, subunit D
MAQILPTKGNLLALKRSRTLAETGHRLMDKKRGILARELLLRLDAVNSLQVRMDAQTQAAHAALAVAKRHHDLADLGETAPIDEGMTLRTRSVMGVLLPRITAAPQMPTLPYPLLHSGPALDEAYLKFYELKHLLIEMAEAQTAVHRLAEAMKKTQKRTNALRHIVLPAMDADVRRITAALEEKEREEYTRLKVKKR